MLIVFLGACSYGILSTFVKIAYDQGFIVNDVVGSQMLIGMIMLSVLQLLLKTKSRPSLKQWVALVLVGVAPGLTGIFYYTSLETIPASLAIVLLFQFTWMGVLLDALLNRSWPSRAKIAALVLLFIGTALAGDLPRQGFQALTWTGAMYGLLSALSYAIFVICSGKVAPDVHPMTRSAIMGIGSVAITFVVFPPVFLVNGSLLHGLFLWGFLLALFGAVIPPLFFAAGVPKIGGGLATILGAAELPTAVFLSRVVLNESVHWLQWVGVAVILLGIALPELHAWRKPASRSAE